MQGPECQESELKPFLVGGDRIAHIPSLAIKLLIMVQAALVAAPASAEFLPPVENLASPDEYAVVVDVAKQMENASATDPKATLAVLDGALARLRQASKLRGMVQFYRAGLLLDQDRNAESIEAAKESIRLLPDYSGPLLAGFSAYCYSDKPGEAADYLLRLVALAPEDVEQVDSYDVGALMRRLNVANDKRRAQLVSERLLEAGWVGDDLTTSSSLALEAIKMRVAKGDLEGARKFVPKLAVPDHGRELLMLNDYRLIWPDIEQWAGHNMQRQWSIYLHEARAQWAASGSVDKLGTYTHALILAGHDDTVIAEVLPLFSRQLDPAEDYELLFVAADLARALAHKGRWQDLNNFYAAAERVWPLGSDVNALNIAANRGKWLLYQGKSADALTTIDAAIADAKRRGPSVNADALGVMNLYRACALHELGRGQEAELSAALARPLLQPSNMAFLYLCLDDQQAARQVMMSALGDPSSREDAIVYFQRNDTIPEQSDYGRMMYKRQEALRSDPALLAEVSKYGRILPYTLRDGAPPEGEAKADPHSSYPAGVPIS